jgi:uncharacterized UBP type Zn finger protein
LNGESSDLQPPNTEDAVVVSPLPIKKAISEIDDEFADESQHDSHELLLSLVSDLDKALSPKVIFLLNFNSSDFLIG